MLAVERVEYILSQLKKNKIVQVSDLSKDMNVTEETIRRDLEKLEQKEVICRVHGGAYLREGYGNETPVTVREKIYQEEKLRIAKACMELIHEQDSILLDCSTTATAIARELNRSGKKATVITNSLKAAQELKGSQSVRLILLGGEYQPETDSFCGEATLEDLERYFADKVFLSSAGISPEAGMTDYTRQEAAVRSRMAARSSLCCFAADLTKIGRRAVYVAAELSRLDYLIVDAPFGEKCPELQETLKAMKKKIIICGEKTDG